MNKQKICFQVLARLTYALLIKKYKYQTLSCDPLILNPLNCPNLNYNVTNNNKDID